MADDETPAWFVTGGATGFGRGLVEAAWALGRRGAARARLPARLGGVLTRRGESASKLSLDAKGRGGVASSGEGTEARFGRIDGAGRSIEGSKAVVGGPTDAAGAPALDLASGRLDEGMPSVEDDDTVPKGRAAREAVGIRAGRRSKPLIARIGADFGDWKAPPLDADGSARRMGRCGVRVAQGAASALLALTAVAGAATSSVPPWPDDATSRLEALALIATLNADLLAHDSATLTLERWCAAHGLASPPTVTAARVPAAEGPADDDVRGRLGVDAAEPVRHRHVRLSCGGHVVSEADNYYLPARLTPEMNRTLDTGDTAFGRAVGTLKFRRHTVSVDLLWHPLPEGWERGAALPPAAPGELAVPGTVLRHDAVLLLPDGTPFSALVETYTGELLAFPKPPPR